jgi:hypothetical protein
MLHIFGNRKYEKASGQWPFWFTIISQAVVNIATIILIYSQCGAHPQALWDSTVQAKCLNPQVQTNFSYFQCGRSVLQFISPLTILQLGTQLPTFT